MPSLIWPLSLRDKAFAAFFVTPDKASNGVTLKSVDDIFIESRIDVRGDDPGLQSVAIAIGTLYFRNNSIGGFCVSFRV